MLHQRIPKSKQASLALIAALLATGFAPSGASEPGNVEDRVLVVFERLPDELASGVEYMGGTIESVNHVLQFAVIVGTPQETVERELAFNDNVVEIRADPIIPMLQLTPNDPLFNSMYGPQQVRAPQAWDVTTGSADTAVCIIDTGVRYTHQDLAGARWLGGYDFVNNDNDPWDDHFHGTHVAGTAAASINNGVGIAGIAEVGIYGVKVLSRYGGGAWSWVANGITWCADNTMDKTVLSLSLGGYGAGSLVNNAVNYAYNTKGKLVVAASGNGYCNNCVIEPAKFDNAIAVGCTTQNTKASIGGLHKRDPAVCNFTSRGSQLEIAAPGSNILSTWYSSNTAYGTISGTSMSTPHVSGALALAWGEFPAADNVLMRTMMQNSAVDSGLPGRDNNYGYGELDVYCLVMGLPVCV